MRNVWYSIQPSRNWIWCNGLELENTLLELFQLNDGLELLQIDTNRKERKHIGRGYGKDEKLVEEMRKQLKMKLEKQNPLLTVIFLLHEKQKEAIRLDEQNQVLNRMLKEEAEKAEKMEKQRKEELQNQTLEWEGKEQKQKEEVLLLRKKLEERTAEWEGKEKQMKEEAQQLQTNLKGQTSESEGKETQLNEEVKRLQKQIAELQNVQTKSKEENAEWEGKEKKQREEVHLLRLKLEEQNVICEGMRQREQESNEELQQLQMKLSLQTVESEAKEQKLNEELEAIKEEWKEKLTKEQQKLKEEKEKQKRKRRDREGALVKTMTNRVMDIARNGIPWQELTESDLAELQPFLENSNLLAIGGEAKGMSPVSKITLFLTHFSFFQVYKGEWQGQVVAIKDVSKYPKQMREELFLTAPLCSDYLVFMQKVTHYC